MNQSDVYFANFRTTFQENLLQKLECLVKKAEILEGIDFNNKRTAVKIHFGEPENLSHLRPNYSKVTVDLIKSQGGKVFLTDCNALYIGGRKNALGHLDAAYENGYNPFATGCHALVANGLKGTDEAPILIDGEYMKEAKIGQAIMGANTFISLAHSKEHESTGFGGTVKNIGMDCGLRAGKMEVYNTGKPHVVASKCVDCSARQENCAHSAITITERKASIDHDGCVGCGRCIDVCPMSVVDDACDKSNDILNCKIAEYTYAVLKDHPHFHVNLVMDVSPYCDCHTENDVSIMPNVGVFASFDPAVLDMVCVGATNRQPVTPGSILSERPHTHHNHFTDIHPNTNWESAIDHTVKMGLGNKEYSLITI